MNNLYLSIQRFMNDEEGVTAIEYGLLASLIAVIIISAVTVTGTNLKTVFENIVTCLKTPNDAVCGVAPG
ncbi:MAG: pilus assembly protein [Methylotenera sp. RIFCSPLOWO2_02_FULL_45_14]|nr:MAG: pilus assembly protein [Methylotenera sp. RIFCSPLOWO2_02_FULL_45_14]